MSKLLTFGELSIGEKFIDFPMDGDDSGHGGFRKGAYVFEKIEPIPTKRYGQYQNAERIMDEYHCTFQDSMIVYKVIL